MRPGGTADTTKQIPGPLNPGIELEPGPLQEGWPAMETTERIASFDRDPFSNTADADAYVPRTATESVLLDLELALRDGARVVCLEGPAGSGKTLLLRVLEERVAEDFSSLRVPYSKLDADEFCRWGLDALGEAPAADPECALAARIARGAATGEPPLVWMIDDADLLPIPTLQTLVQLQRGTGDALRLLLVRSGELPAEAAEEFARAGVVPVNVELEGEMGSTEMAHYVRARLVRAGADPAVRAQLEAALDRLYARSHGNPGLLHAAAAALLCFGPDRLSEPVAAEPALPPEPSAEIPTAEIAVSAPVLAAEPEIAVESPTVERVSIESLVAEAVASEPPEEIAVPEPIAVPRTALVAPAEPTPDSPASAPPPDHPPRPAPRKRHRLRRLGRR